MQAWHITKLGNAVTLGRFFDEFHDHGLVSLSTWIGTLMQTCHDSVQLKVVELEKNYNDLHDLSSLSDLMNLGRQNSSTK
jgi:hypothetical protein